MLLAGQAPSATSNYRATVARVNQNYTSMARHFGVRNDSGHRRTELRRKHPMEPLSEKAPRDALHRRQVA